MEALDYIHIFRLDQPNYEYNRQEFIDALGQEFKSNIDLLNKVNHISYEHFKSLVNNFSQKFKAIQDNAITKPTDGVWKAFYAQYVLDSRHHLFTFKDFLIRKNKGFDSQLKTSGKKVLMEYPNP